ncbi:MAG: calcium-binding protein [Neisseria sp.]|nr:calcium-binding protein [Neisseria sp.]
MLGLVSDGIETAGQALLPTGVGTGVGAAVHGVGSSAGLGSSLIAAAAYTMSQSKVDAAIWDPQKQTGLPTVSDIVDKLHETLSGNNSDFNNAINDAKATLGDAVSRALDGLSDVYDMAADALNASKDDIYDLFDNLLNKALEGEKAFGDWLKDKFDDIGDWWDQAQKDFGDWFIPFAKDLGDLIKLPWDGKYHIVDPMVLDLDGDGIEVMAAKQYQGALFDFNKDGIRVSTGWIKPDDGLLVIDRNGDGVINNGGELFGDAVVLADGAVAAHGYAALAEFDSNGDGKVDEADEQFADLRVWRDLDSDGISDGGELFTLNELGIQSLNTAYQNTNTGLGNGNILAQKGSYTKSDGSTGLMGDVNFWTNNLYASYADKIELTAEQMKAANLQGIGGLRDLREAAALSDNLNEVLKAYSQAETKEAQQALLEEVIWQWASTNPYFGANITVGNQLVQTASEGIALTPAQLQAMQNQRFVITDEMKQAVDETTRKLAVVNSFSGIRSAFIGVYTWDGFNKVIEVADKQYATLMQSVYEGLLFQTRLQPYLNAVTLVLADGAFEVDYSGVPQAFDKVYAENPHKAFVDLGEFIAFNHHNHLSIFDDLSVRFTRFTQSAVNVGLFEEYGQTLGAEALEKLGHKLGGTGKDIFHGNHLANYLIGEGGDDVLSGGDGDDILSGGDGNDVLYGGNDNDTLIGGSGNDILYGGSEADTYIFSVGHGQDIVSDSGQNLAQTNTLRFEDTTSTDAVFSRSGNDLLLRAYSGTDDLLTVQNYFGSSNYRYHQFAFDDKTITAADMTNITVAGGGSDKNDNLYGWDTVDIISGGLGNDHISGENGNDRLYGNEGDDSLYGGNGDDHLEGADGNDRIDGGNGNDYLDGGEGNDRLNGDAGIDILLGGAGDDQLSGGNENDTLIGGSGNDILYGGNGADTYIFAAGHGRDIVKDSSYHKEDVDTLLFQDVLSSNVLFEKDGVNLLIKAFGEEEQVSVANYFSGSNYRYMQFAFEDKTLSSAEVSAGIV